MHYSAVLRLSNKDVVLTEQPPKRQPTKTEGEVLRTFRVPLGENMVDVLFQTVFTVTGLRHFAKIVPRGQDVGLPHQEVPFLRATHQFHHAGNSYDVRLLAMWE